MLQEPVSPAAAAMQSVAFGFALLQLQRGAVVLDVRQQLQQPGWAVLCCQVLKLLPAVSGGAAGLPYECVDIAIHNFLNPEVRLCGQRSQLWVCRAWRLHCVSCRPEPLLTRTPGLAAVSLA